MQEYDLYVPLHYNDGTPVEQEKLDRLRRRLVERFGGLTDFRYRSEGLWKVGNVTFRDEIVIYRVLADAGPASRSFFTALKEQLKADLGQHEVLIVGRNIEVV